MTSKTQASLDRAVVGLRTELGDNLYACCLYGSAVRGNSVEGVSDLNLLIVLQESAPAAHAAIARVIGADPLIDPFILGRRGLARSARAFAPKFASIRRNYRVLYGADPLVDFQVDPALEKFLCEQALRNLRLRLIYSFVTRQRHKSYDRFLQRNITGLFVNFSEALRLHGVTVPVAFEGGMLTVRMNPHRLTRAFLDRIGDEGTTEAEFYGPNAVVTGWDLQDEDGQPIPLNDEGLAQVPMFVRRAVATAVLGATVPNGVARGSEGSTRN